MNILARTDTLAVQCVEEAMKWDGGNPSPSAKPNSSTPTTARTPPNGRNGSSPAPAQRRSASWIRVADGSLYLAPKHSYYGLSWGYGGSGPGSLARLIDRLLSDINAAPADDVNGAADGLKQLTQTDWPNGTILTRAQPGSGPSHRTPVTDDMGAG